MVVTTLPVQVGEALDHTHLLDFVDAESDYARLVTSLDVIADNNAFTFAAWAATRRTAWTTDDGEWQFFGSHENSTHFLAARVEDGAGNEGKFQSSSRDAGGFSGNIQTSNVMFLDWRWNSVVRVFAEGANMGILNGDVGGMASNAESKPDYSTHDTMEFGRFSASGVSDHWDGFIFMAGLWRGVWTVEDAMKHADGCHPFLINSGDLQHLWPLAVDGRDIVGHRTTTLNGPAPSQITYSIPVRMEEDLWVPAAVGATVTGKKSSGRVQLYQAVVSDLANPGDTVALAIDPAPSHCFLGVQMFDSAGDPIAAAGAGSFAVAVKTLNSEQFEAPPDPTIDATDPKTINFAGNITSVRVTPSSVAGNDVTTWRVVVTCNRN